MTLYEKQCPYKVWYNFCLMPIIVCIVFLLFKNLELKSFKGLVTQFASGAFGVYLLHKPIQMVLIRSLGEISKKSMEILAVTVYVYLIPFVIVWSISKIPCCGKVLFRFK